MMKQLKHINIKHIPNRLPNSSEIAEYIKSAATTGMDCGIPIPTPIPKKPPVPIANKDCAI